jgi:hypothetical protein
MAHFRRIGKPERRAFALWRLGFRAFCLLA